MHEAAEENHRSPRLSWANGEGDNFGDLSQYAEDLAAGVNSKLGGSDADASDEKTQREDNSAVAQNGGLSGKDDDSDADGDTDESLDDDMMDKISSSPSIEDGGCDPFLLPQSWPRRVDSLPSRRNRPASPVFPSSTLSDPRSSSPYLDTPDHLPLQPGRRSKASVNRSPPPLRQHRHLHSEYSE